MILNLPVAMNYGPLGAFDESDIFDETLQR